MSTAAFPSLISGGFELDTAPDTLGELRDSSADRHNLATLRTRMAAEGYLFFRGLLQREEVLEARAEVCRRLAEQGWLEPGTEASEGIIAAGKQLAFRPDVAAKNPPLEQVLYDGPMMAFWREFLGGPVRHFDYTWLRAISPGPGTPSHCDVVYMGRGTPNLFTAWTPLGEVDYTLGGLIMLEGSNNHQRLRSTYCQEDVDAYCTNKDGPAGQDAWQRGTGGWLSKNAPQIRKSLGGRWLTAEYQPGDVVVFSVYTVHASLDNRTTNRIRFSSDSRYQLASEPADERWIGDNPPGHGPAGKKGLIC